MVMLNAFDSDAFGVVSLTDAINKIKFVPGRLGQLGLFSESGVTTTKVAIEEKDGVLKLIPPTPRGAPGTTVEKSKRSMLSVDVPHFEVNDAIMAEEVQNVRAFGTENAMETVMSRVGDRLTMATNSMAATQEYSRIGAMKGLVTYADGSSLNLFTLFGVTQQAEVDFDLDNASPASGALRKKCAQVIRLLANELDGIPFSGYAIAECGDAFFDDLLAHPEVVDSYKGTNMAAVLREGYLSPTAGQKIYGAFEFGGIIWENYRGSVGSTTYVATDKCHIAPMGAPGLFRTYYAPADYEETVNTMGQRLYSKQYQMPNGKGRHLDTQMNALDICTRPRCLIQGKRT